MHQTRIVAVGIFIGAALTACTADRGPTVEEDEEALRALAARTLEAEVTEDLDGWLETIAEDAVLLTNDGPVRGRNEIRQRFATSFSDYDWEGNWAVEEIEVSGDLAVMWGPMETTLTPRGGGSQIRRSAIISTSHDGNRMARGGSPGGPRKHAQLPIPLGTSEGVPWSDRAMLSKRSA